MAASIAVAKNSTLGHVELPENKTFADHVGGAAPQTPGTWEPTLNIHNISFYNASNKLAVPAAGLNVMENGDTCADASGTIGCSAPAPR